MKPQWRASSCEPPPCCGDARNACNHSVPSLTELEALTLAREQCPQAPFIFVSGYVGERRAGEALKAGAADYILED